MTDKIFLLFLILVLLKVVYNAYYWLLTEWYCHKYWQWGNGSRNGASYIDERRQAIVKVLQKAGIKDQVSPYAQMAGFGMVANRTVSYFDNLSYPNEEIIKAVNTWFIEAIGAYKQRIFESLNPFYWIELVIYAPKHFALYVGFDSENWFMKIIQFGWNIFVIFSTIIGFVFNREFTDWIQNLDFWQKFFQ